MMIDFTLIPITEDLCFVITCAIRYCIGRKTYAPHKVIKFVTPLLPYLDDVSLVCIERDLTNPVTYGGFGDPNIDDPAWMSFKQAVGDEINKRRKERKNDGNL